MNETKIQFTNVVLSHRRRNQNVTRPKQGQSVLKLVGECIAAGGAVQMETRYVSDEEVANVTLEWP